MDLNLTQVIQSRLVDSTLAAIGGQLGLDPKTARAGTAVLIPIILGAMLKIDANGTGSDRLLAIIRSGQHEGTLIDRFPVMLSSGRADSIPSQGSELIQTLLGSDAEPVIASVSQKLGFKPIALRSLWAMMTPVVVDVIAGQIDSQKFRTKEFRKLLRSQQNDLAKVMPPDVAELLRLRDGGSNTVAAAGKLRRIDVTYIIAFFISAAAVFWLSQVRFKPPPVDEVGDVTSIVPTAIEP
jgi:hypothetical protein